MEDADAAAVAAVAVDVAMEIITTETTETETISGILAQEFAAGRTGRDSAAGIGRDTVKAIKQQPGDRAEMGTNPRAVAAQTDRRVILENGGGGGLSRPSSIDKGRNGRL